MKKLLALIVAAALISAQMNPICAAETEVTVAVEQTTRSLGVTPRLTIPKLPKVPQIRVKVNYNIDYSKYIPKITLS